MGLHAPNQGRPWQFGHSRDIVVSIALRASSIVKGIGTCYVQLAATQRTGWTAARLALRDSRSPNLNIYTPLADRRIIAAVATKKTSRRSGARVFWAPRVLAMRETMGLSQRGFAKLVGVSVKTLQNWEQGRRQPSGPAVVLLTVLVVDPDAVLRALR